jgi:hypothetical protein
VYYTIRDGRSHTKVEALVASFAGVLMCDGYSGYVSLSTKYPRVILAHCWAHVRRKFVAIEASFPVLCGEVLDLRVQIHSGRKSIVGSEKNRSPELAIDRGGAIDTNATLCACASDPFFGTTAT